MSYMLAKHVASLGSIALKREKSNSLTDAAYIRKLSQEYLDAGIEILTIGNFAVHAEYKPVTYAKSRKEFEQKIEEMYLRETGTLNYVQEAIRTAIDDDFEEIVKGVTNKSDDEGERHE